ncbi:MULTISPECIES: hypothetical protein [Gordonia]|uniref:Uncharacterized protein n=2 Tax=Gordonia TaxID=2053 RepID=L7LJC8_9ACTN|nr:MULTISPECIES: hypothetical protein [Gordonia]AUH68271.1 hypothetical protein CXX93_07780 [Gordonia sp. YC-JH1]KJR06810.1 hypothetical protein UG54_12660 [Gordonia sihwensis]KXT55731.1 hypothetical protein Y710_17520 [Gordonia sp. QH-12]MBY4569920.1 hypothetical protein [Gordonia sihwensis]WFN91965.1 hypothetical protein P5P27_14465 [Gordonia sihwensis]
MANHSIRRSGHGNHWMGLVAFVLLMVGGAFSALWVITLADLPDNKPTNITYGVLALGCLIFSAMIFTFLVRRLHHSPVMPDNTPDEIARYLAKVRP